MSFKFIDGDDTGYTAADSASLTDDDLTYSGIFVGDTEELYFRLGNTGTTDKIFDISASGVNSTIIDDVEFSLDNGQTWATTASISGVKPNAVTDLIKMRYTPADGEILGVGSFLLRVDES